ncbi:transposase [Paenibacillus medicaginis]|uniref:Transposase n=1 Tax=Paenibacillus medicaginis TaxID=1470560 RepID=A0ABV5C5B2_9BACL
MRTCRKSLWTALPAKFTSMRQGQKRAEHAETNQEIGVSRGGRNTKIHAVVDALGNPIRLVLTAGNRNDCSVAVDVLSGVALSGSVV